MFGERVILGKSRSTQDAFEVLVAVISPDVIDQSGPSTSFKFTSLLAARHPILLALVCDKVDLQATSGVEIFFTVWFWTGKRRWMVGLSMCHQGTPVGEHIITPITDFSVVIRMLCFLVRPQLSNVQESRWTELTLLWIVSGMSVEMLGQWYLL